MNSQSTSVFPFGKYQGKTVAEVAAKDPGYLQWFVATDIPARYPELALQIQVALQGGVAEARIPQISEVTLINDDLPDLKGTVRGGGRMTDGVNQLNRLHLNGFDWRREWMPLAFDHRSGSGKSGSFGWDVPNDDGVYEIHATEGSIMKHTAVTTYWLRRAGCWSRIDGERPAVIAVLRSLAESESS